MNYLSIQQTHDLWVGPTHALGVAATKVNMGKLVSGRRFVNHGRKSFMRSVTLSKTTGARSPKTAILGACVLLFSGAMTSIAQEHGAMPPPATPMKEDKGMMGMMGGMSGGAQNSAPATPAAAMGMCCMGEMGGMSGAQAAGGMSGMGGAQPAAGMAGMSGPSSAMPAQPGASHLYHIGSTGFFLNHPQHITLTQDQKMTLNRLKEKAMLDRASTQRRIDQGEQELYILTGADQPDISKIQAKVTEIEKLRGDERMNFIQAVADATKVLTHEQHLALIGTMTASKK